jgi:hypothetical protein
MQSNVMGGVRIVDRVIVVSSKLDQADIIRSTLGTTFNHKVPPSLQVNTDLVFITTEPTIPFSSSGVSALPPNQYLYGHG